jgi:hypothetical protein
MDCGGYLSITWRTRMPKQTSRFDSAQTNLLAQLRAAAGVSQQAAARYFGLKDRGTIHAWESAFSSPPAKHRARFFGYLLDHLGLRSNPAEFFKLWEAIMVNQWEWEPPLETELQAFFPHGTPAAYARRPAIFLAPPKLAFELVGRGALAQELRQRLFALQETALYGLPGIGKTSLAITLANDREVLQRFPAGVLWARLGRQADVLGELGKWGLALGMTVQDVASLTTIPQRSEAIHRLIGLQRLLIVVDDVWQIESALAFQLGGPNCVRLYTTRSPAIAAHFTDDSAIAVPELDQQAGLQLLRRLAPAAAQREAKAAASLVKQVGGLPLALVLLAGHLRSSESNGANGEIAALLQQLQATSARMKIAAPQAPVRRHPSLPDAAYISLQAAIELSYQVLSPPL